MASTSDFRNGMTLVLDGEIFTLVEFQHVKPGKGVAFVRTRLKNLKTGAVLDRTFRSGDKVEDIRLEKRSMQYLYRDGAFYCFMDNENYEQYELSADAVGEATRFMQENTEVSVLVHGNQPISVELPYFVELKISETDPGLRGDTATGGTKPATLETGLVVQVPLFINEEDVLKIDTRTGEYVERA